MQALLKKFVDTRIATDLLVQSLEIEDYVIQTAEYMSPPKWHLGHTSWFFEMLFRSYIPEYKIYNESFLYYFNSYYEKFGERIARGERGSVSRPTVKETKKYRSAIDDKMHEVLTGNKQISEEFYKLIFLGLEHEMQHQELILWDIKHLLCDLYKPSFALRHFPNHQNHGGEIEIPGQMFVLGYTGNNFSWDNEKAAHKVYVNDFCIDSCLVSNEQYLEFIKSGGYLDSRHWLNDGWLSVKKEKWEAPLYWENHGVDWHIRDFRGVGTVNQKAKEPVTHLSYYEASAYAKWAGKRLPTEAEWELAATMVSGSEEKNIQTWDGCDPEFSRANFFESEYLAPVPIGSLPEHFNKIGLFQMFGDVWQWTSSDYAPYPGFRTEFEEYNDKFFVNQRVLRGGSFATPARHFRSTYRNFFYPQERWIGTGLRCARTPHSIASGKKS